ncbi:uncharacterized protein [Mobula birostris]|uniref:uncharacterized protein n=1 Tax=Mobula birostris TaxID=1983395 RepID=UPI003B28D71A
MAVTGVVAHLTIMFLLLGRVAFVSGTNVRGVTGQSITLPCRYSVRKYIKSGMCWGRGQCGVRNWGDELFGTNGDRVTSVTSQRYSLGGRIAAGDVSPTINDLQREDSGWYCCRVQIPGPFNDLKTNLNLRVLGGTSTTSASPTIKSLSADHGNDIAPSAYQDLTTSLSTSPRDSSSTPHLPEPWILELELRNLGALGLKLRNLGALGLKLRNLRALGLELRNLRALGVELRNLGALGLKLRNPGALGLELRNLGALDLDHGAQSQDPSLGAGCRAGTRTQYTEPGPPPWE